MDKVEIVVDSHPLRATTCMTLIQGHNERGFGHLALLDESWSLLAACILTNAKLVWSGRMVLLKFCHSWPAAN